MSHRTFHMHGRADDAGGMVTVDGKVVHNGIFTDGVLFEFVTESTRHGKADVMISMTFGSIIIDKISVTYPAVIGGMTGFVDFPQPIAQPLQPLMLPLTIDGDIEYSHYAHNGPMVWIVDAKPQRYIYIESVHEAYTSGSMKPDWQYRFKKIGGVENIDDLSELMRGGPIIPPIFARIYRRLRRSINL